MTTDHYFTCRACKGAVHVTREECGRCGTARPDLPTWKVQLGQGKSKYRTRYALPTEGQARAWYESLNTHSGHKKRLLDPDGNVIERVLT